MSRIINSFLISNVIHVLKITLHRKLIGAPYLSISKCKEEILEHADILKLNSTEE
jgi:hypothetical protein